MKFEISRKFAKVYLTDSYQKSIELTPEELEMIKILGNDSISFELDERVSQRTGSLYTCLVLKISDYHRFILLSSGELFLLDIAGLNSCE